MDYVEERMHLSTLLMSRAQIFANPEEIEISCVSPPLAAIAISVAYRCDWKIEHRRLTGYNPWGGQ